MVETAPDTRMAKGLIEPSSNPVVKLEKDEYPYEASVLNMTPLSEIKTDAIEVTGIAYMDGILQIQICHGDSGRLNDVWRRGFIYRYNEDGEEVLPEIDGYMYWYERVNGKMVEFIEYYYIMSEEEARELPLVIEYVEAKGNFNTVWKVNFEVEK